MRCYCCDSESATWRRSSPKFAAPQMDALAHSNESVSATVQGGTVWFRCGEPAPVVVDFDGERPR